MKKIYYLFIFLLPSFLFSESTHLKYLKFGTECGAGYRFHKKNHGCDLSLNYSTLFGETWTSGKALYLFYPYYSSQHSFYLGMGGGIVYGTLDVKGSASPLLNNGKGRVRIHEKKTYPTFESFVGYEFLTDKKVTIFTQLELTIPYQSTFFPLYIHEPGEGWKPAISLGVGF